MPVDAHANIAFFIARLALDHTIAPHPGTPKFVNLELDAKAARHQAAASCGLYFVAELVLMVAIQLTEVRLEGSVVFPFGALLVAGALTWGGLRTAEFIRWSANLILGSSVMLPLALLMQPLSLTWAWLRLAPGYALVSSVDLVLIFVLNWWLARVLGSASVQEARLARGYKVRSNRLPLALGALASVASLASMADLMHGATAKHAVDLVSRQLGADYECRATYVGVSKSLNTGETHHAAQVQCWNQQSIQSFPVSW